MLPKMLFGPRQMPAPPITSIASFVTIRARDVVWYFITADSTAGCSCFASIALMSI